MYVTLCVPYIVPFEDHPFTLSSAPEQDYFSVHIQVHYLILCPEIYSVPCQAICPVLCLSDGVHSRLWAIGQKPL